MTSNKRNFDSDDGGGGDDDGNDDISNDNPTSTPIDNDNDNDEDRVEKAFALLTKAKSSESKNDFWKATGIYIQAHTLLTTLAEEQAISAKIPKYSDDDNGNNNIENNILEHKRIATLYKDKANEYWSHSRHCLIQAMEQEKEKDELGNDFVGESSDLKATKRPLTCSQLHDNEARERNYTFVTLFSKPVQDAVSSSTIPGYGNESSNKEGSDHDSNDVIMGQQWSLEERLNALNKSLPSSLKTDEQRMSELNKSLNKLGLSVYTQREPFERFQEPIKSEDEQINDIIAQAQDEVQFEKQNKSNTNIDAVNNKPVDHDDDDDYDDDDSEDDEDEEEGDMLLEDDQIAIKKIRNKVVKAQIKIAELVALLDEVKTAKDKEHKEDEEKNLHDDDDDDTSNNLDPSNTTELLVSGKKKLKGAQRDLKKAMTEWIENL